MPGRYTCIIQNKTTANYKIQYTQICAERQKFRLAENQPLTLAAEHLPYSQLDRLSSPRTERL
jgi:hypothetical protein